MEDIVRVPIKIKRTPITVATDNGWSLGKWYAFPKPNEQPRVLGKLKSNQRKLWCPWCDEWQIFEKGVNEDKWYCTGVCGFGNTNEFYTKSYNDLWFEGSKPRK